jgi:hypothetical protein
MGILASCLKNRNEPTNQNNAFDIHNADPERDYYDQAIDSNPRLLSSVFGRIEVFQYVCELIRPIWNVDVVNIFRFVQAHSPDREFL